MDLKLRDLYGNMGMLDTTEQTVIDDSDKEALTNEETDSNYSGTATNPNKVKILAVIGILIAVTFVAGYVNK